MTQLNKNGLEFVEGGALDADGPEHDALLNLAIRVLGEQWAGGEGQGGGGCCGGWRSG